MIRFEVVSRFTNDPMEINLPKRQTLNAVAYDFEAAENITIPSLFQQVWENISRLEPIDIKSYLVPTGIKATFPDGVGLFLANRSGGPKIGLVLANAIGVVDKDFYSNSSNDGEIQFQFYNFSLKPLHIKKGQRIGQGWFAPILLCDDDQPVNRKRAGGHGHTGLL